MSTLYPDDACEFLLGDDGARIILHTPILLSPEAFSINDGFLFLLGYGPTFRFEIPEPELEGFLSAETISVIELNEAGGEIESEIEISREDFRADGL